MNVKKIMIVLQVLCIVAGKELIAQNHNSQKVEKKSEPLTIEKAVKEYGYPQIKKTANPDADYAEYKKAKDAWIAKNPDLYKKMQEDNSTKPVTVSTTAPK